MMTYLKYRELVENLLEEGKSTGNKQTEALTQYSFLNSKRMKRLDKKGELSNEAIETLKEYNKSVEWIVLTESWCGDAAQVLPYVNKMASLNENIDLKIALRDDNLDLMDQHLTNGGRAIPKLIMIDKKTKEVINTFGPRPQKATQMVADYKEANGILTPEFKKDLQVWYTKDKGQEIVKDLLNLLS